jgi:predicted GIY-YIG superfamily endonuclease
MSERQTVLYRVFDSDDRLIYAGISLQFFARMQQHRNHSTWFDKMAKVTVQKFETRGEAIAAEAKAIHEEDPLMNIMRPRSKEIEKARKELERDFNRRIAESRDELTAQIVRFKVSYTLEEAAAVIGITRAVMRDLLEKGVVGSLLVPRKGGVDRNGNSYKLKRVISGWQIIDYLESLHFPKPKDEQ